MALYAVAGFFVVPAVARSQAVSFLKDRYGLALVIGKIRFNPFTFVARIEHLSLTAPDGERLLAFDAFSADFELRSLIERAVVFKSIASTRPYVHVHLRPDGTLNLARAFAGRPHQEPSKQEKTSAPPALIVEYLALTGGDLHVTDNTRGRDFDAHFTPLALHMQHLSTRPEDRSNLTGLTLNIGAGGRLAVSGDLSAIPTRFTLKLAARDIPLATFQPYLAERLPAVIGDGRLSFDLLLSQGQPGQTSELALAGRATISALSVKLKDRDDPVLAWDEVIAAGIRLDIAPNRLAIDEIAVKGLDTAFKIYADGRTNVSEIAQRATSDTAAGQNAAPKNAPVPEEDKDAGKPEASPFPYAIKRITVDDSRLLYGDEQIRPHVLVRIRQLAGEIRDIASAPETRTVFALAGRVGDYGKAEIGGAVRIAAPKSDLNAKVSFKNVELTSFSPYAGKFAGYSIDKGKLFLDLRYTLIHGRIKGGNHAVFDQFELGDKVSSRDATKLPVKFALSLLRDRNGRIDLSLPVEGDVDSPGFRFGPLIVKALVNFVTRIVTAPFTYIAGLFGGGPDMEYALFDAGSATLSAAEHDKILPLSKALAARPQLLVEIQGWADPGTDAAALRQAKLDALLATAAQTAAPEAVLTMAYDTFFGAGAAAALRTKLEATPAPVADPAAAPPPAMGSAAIAAELRARLLAAQPVSEEELTMLAYTRGQRVMDVLVRDGGIAAERVFVRRGEIAKGGEGTRVKLILNAR